jgi:TolB-like protein/Tfp pilus assembly protein PilF
MSDVFVSYKAEDRARVRPLVAALEADGLTVWWDAQIQGGAAWRQSIQRELEAAGCVVVVWSKRSVGPEGEFVHDEASLARKRGVYMPVRIDAVEPPLGFGQTQALALTGWKGERSDPRYQALLGAARGMIGGEARTGSLPIAPERSRIDRRLLLVGGGVLAAGVAGAGGWALWSRMGAGSDDKSVAVLPFANLSSDPSQAYFADGLAEELRSALSRIGQLKVIARASCEAVRNAPITEAARKLGVATVLTGSVRRSPTLIRVSAQLVDGRSGVERWSETYDRAPGDALEIQSGIAESVAGALRVRLGQAGKAALTVGGTRNAAAQDLFLQSRELINADDSEAGVRKVLALLDAALALDPDYAEAHATRANALIGLAIQYARSAEDQRTGYAQATAAARRAVALAPRLAKGYAALGSAAQYQLDMSDALVQYQRAMALAGDDAGTLQAYAQFLSDLGRSDESAALAARVVALDPLNSRSYARQSLVLFYARRYGEAAAAARRALAMAPKRSTTRVRLGDCLLLLGKISEAQAEYAQAPADGTLRLAGEAIAAARLGDRAGSDKPMAKLKQLDGDLASYQYGQIHAQRGEIDQAFAALDQAWTVRDPGLSWLHVDPFLDPLRGDPRYKVLERKLNFPA